MESIKHYFTKLKIKNEYRIALLALVVSAVCASIFIPRYVAAGELSWATRDINYWLVRIPKVLIGALIISVIEESFFRGLVFSNIKKVSGSLVAAFISSAIYASVHFIRPIGSWEYRGLSLTVGFEYLGEVFAAMMNLDLLPSFIGLFVVGLVLCRIFEKTGSLVLCIGLHMGWVVAIKLSVYMTNSIPGYVYEGGRRYFLVGKPLVWASVILVFVLTSLTLSKKFKPAQK